MLHIWDSAQLFKFEFAPKTQVKAENLAAGKAGS